MTKNKLQYYAIAIFTVLALYATIFFAQDTYAYKAGEKACATLTWTKKETSSSGETKTGNNATVKICTAEVDENGNINGDISISYGGDAESEIVKFNNVNGGYLSMLCQNKGLIGVETCNPGGNMINVNKGQSFQSVINSIAATLKAQQGSVVVTHGTTQQKEEYTMKDEIIWQPTMSESGNTKKETTTIGGGSTSPTDPNNPGEGDSGQNSDSKDDVCFSHAGAIGWVACPIASASIELLGKVYDIIEKDYLQIKATDIFKDSGGAYTAWNTFRNIANIAFVVLLLIVILSQVTGIGINNYGIKKLLPKLILTAILINLSYIICMLLVDLSNILGMSLRAFLTTIGEAVQEGGASVGDSYQASGTQYVVVFGSVAAIALGATVFLNPGMVATVVLFLLTAVIAVLFLWIILVVRQAGVILAVVLAPLAFCCFLLPNTEKYGKKWIDIMKGLLLLYPICSLMVGGGMLAGSIIGSVSDSVGLSLAAMVLQVVPFFFIPTVFRRSLTAMGNVGARLSNAGNNLRRGTNRRISNSDLYKRGQTRLGAAGINGARGKVLSKLPGGSRRMNNARLAYNRMRKEDIDAAAGGAIMSSGSDAYTAYETAAQKRALDEEIANAAIVLGKKTQNGANQSLLFEEYKAAAARGDTATMMAAIDMAGRRKDTAQAFASEMLNPKNNVTYAKDDGLQKAMQRISEGSNAQNFRSSSPVEFEYASSITRGDYTNKDTGKVNAPDFATWSSDPTHISDATEHHITNYDELNGMKSKSLQTLASNMDRLSIGERERISAMANKMLDLYEQGKYNNLDTTKMEQFNRIAGRSSSSRTPTDVNNTTAD